MSAIRQRDGDCLGRTPFASLIALTISWIGVAVFSVMNFRAVSATLQQLKNTFQAELFWLNKVQLAFICSAVIMFVFCFVLAVIGAFATGATRDNIYYGWKARFGGRISTVIFMILTYVILLLWLVLFSIVVVLTVTYALLMRLCNHVPSYTADTCLNLSILQALFTDTYTNKEWNVCGVSLQHFCTLTESATNNYAVGCFATVAVLLGLVHFLICLAANYAHIKDGFKYFELKEIQFLEENELAKYGRTVTTVY